MTDYVICYCDVFQSHSNKQGYWDGRCGHQHVARLLKDMVYMENITDAMGQLRTDQS